jgi:protein PsiE
MSFVNSITRDHLTAPIIAQKISRAIDWGGLKMGRGVHFDVGGRHQLADSDLTKGAENQRQADSSDNVGTKPLLQEISMSIKRVIDVTEKCFLVIIALFTVGAMVQEVMLLIEQRSVALKDLLLMFIYAEVLGMLGAFYSSHRIPITIPLIIAMTALSRLIILQGKDGDPTILLYESGAILMIAVACWVISHLKDRD